MNAEQVKKPAKKATRKVAPARTRTSGGVSYDAAALIRTECDELADMLIAKNQKYGNSALEPMRVFSRASPVEQILTRIDDKISRLRVASLDEDEDVVLDLLGYLVLLRVARSISPIPYRLTGGAVGHIEQARQKRKAKTPPEGA